MKKYENSKIKVFQEVEYSGEDMYNTEFGGDDVLRTKNGLRVSTEKPLHTGRGNENDSIISNVTRDQLSFRNDMTSLPELGPNRGADTSQLNLMEKDYDLMK